MKQKQFNSTNIIVFFFLVPFVFSSCRLYHLKTRTVMHNNAQTLVNENAFQYLLIHIGNSYWELANPSVKNESISGELKQVDQHVDYYYRQGLKRNNFSVTK
jgi:hypothetical protein